MLDHDLAASFLWDVARSPMHRNLQHVVVVFTRLLYLRKFLPRSCRACQRRHRFCKPGAKAEWCLSESWHGAATAPALYNDDVRVVEEYRRTVGTT